MSELLRFATAGSVDDGKSTLIGRLLYDSKSIFEDQLEAVADASERMGARGHQPGAADRRPARRARAGHHDRRRLPLLRHATRKFIIADTPGHVQYTRNMVTGASTADLAIVLVDARKGVLEQSRRHAFIASLLRIPHLVLAVNKMDLVDYDRDALRRDRRGVPAVRRQARHHRPDLHPDLGAATATTSCSRSANMPWYEGPSLLHHLEEVHIASDRNLIDARFPVQYVIRPQTDEYHDYRGYAGTVAGGRVQARRRGRGAAVGVHLDASRRSTPSDGPVDEAFAPMSVTIRLDRRDRHLPRRHDLPAPQPARRRPRTSTRWSAG